jgi:Spy/CpxP family protein refolding chaperone
MVANRHKALLIIFSAFSLGVLTGILAMNLFPHRPPTGAPGPAGVMDELAREVKLDAGQRTQVEQILAETRQKFEALQDQTRPQFNEIRQASRTRIRAVLTPEQQTRYDEWNRKRDAIRQQRERSQGHNGGK